MNKHSEFIDFHRQALKRDLKITTEGFGSTMRAFIPTVFTGLVSSMTETIPSEEVVKFSRDQRKFVDLTSKIPYSRLEQVNVLVPEGMTTSYLQTLQALRAAALHAKVKIPEMLSQYGRYVAVLLNTPDAWLSTKDELVYYNGIDKERTALASTLDGCYTADEPQTTVKYGDVIARNTEWPEVFKTALELTDVLNTIDRKQINKSIKNIMELVELIKNKARVDGTVNDNASSQVISSLADGAYNIAKELEFYSVVHYRSLAITEAIEGSTRRVTDYANTLGVEV